MSSNIEIKRICQHCQVEFTAKTTVTKYCSHKCANRAYKLNKRTDKIHKAEQEIKNGKNDPFTTLKTKEFLSLRETSTLIGVSRRTLYRIIERGEFPKYKIGTRTIIKRSDIDKLFTTPIHTNTLTTPRTNDNPDFSETYTIGEIENKFNISDKGLYSLLKKNNVPKQKRGKYTHVPRSIIDKLLG